MASNITIETDLEDFVPVYNPMEIVILENDAPTLALTNFKYLFDVYIEGVSSYKRYEVAPESVTNMGVVDISRFCEGYVYNPIDVPYPSGPFLLGANAAGQASIIKVTVKYGYSYLNSGTYTAVPDQVTGSAKYAWNASLEWRTWVDGFDYNDYICNITNGSVGQWLTTMKTHYVSLDNVGYMSVLTDTPTDIDRVVYETYDSTGTLIATNIKAIAVAQNLTVSRMYRVATGPEQINTFTGGWISGGPVPIITSDVSYYIAYLIDSAGNIASEEITFYLQEPCRYEQRRLHFVNQLGSWEAFNFNLRSTERREVERKGYKYDKYPLTASGLNRRVLDQAQVTNYTATQDWIKLTSDFITEEQNTWLKQLIESPEIYMEITDSTGEKNYYAIETIVGNSWVEKQTKNDKLFLLEVEIKLSHKNYRQRR